MESFIVRVWVPAQNDDGGNGAGNLKGLIVHPASGVTASFAGAQELLASIRTTLSALGDSPLEIPKEIVR